MTESIQVRFSEIDENRASLVESDAGTKDRLEAEERRGFLKSFDQIVPINHKQKLFKAYLVDYLTKGKSGSLILTILQELPKIFFDIFEKMSRCHPYKVLTEIKDLSHRLVKKIEINKFIFDDERTWAYVTLSLVEIIGFEFGHPENPSHFLTQSMKTLTIDPDINNDNDKDIKFYHCFRSNDRMIRQAFSRRFNSLEKLNPSEFNENKRLQHSSLMMLCSSKMVGQINIIVNIGVETVVESAFSQNSFSSYVSSHIIIALYCTSIESLKTFLVFIVPLSNQIDNTPEITLTLSCILICKELLRFHNLIDESKLFKEWLWTTDELPEILLMMTFSPFGLLIYVSRDGF